MLKSSALGVAFDGANVWVANFNDNTVTKLRAADGTSLAPSQQGRGLMAWFLIVPTSEFLMGPASG
jgi:hypothetical protein